MKVLLFIDSLVIGGAQRQILNLAEGLHQSGADIRLCTYYPIDDLLKEKECAITVECFNKSFKYDLMPMFRLRQVIKQFDPTVVIAFLSTPSFYAELLKLTGISVPLIVSERSSRSRSGGMRQIIDYLSGVSHTLSSAVIFNSYQAMELKTQRHPYLKSKSRVIFNGVEDRFFNTSKASQTSPTELDSSYESTHTRFCVISSRLIKEKGLFDLIEAAATVNKIYNGTFSIDWIGSYDERSTQYRQATELLTSHGLNENWCWVGKHDHLESVYGQYDSAVIASHSEGLTNVLCEAMAAQLPIVATDIADHRHILQESQCGFLCEPKNPGSLADALLQMIKLKHSEKATLGKNAHQFASINFGMEKYISNWSEAVASVLR